MRVLSIHVHLDKSPGQPEIGSIGSFHEYFDKNKMLHLITFRGNAVTGMDYYSGFFGADFMLIFYFRCKVYTHSRTLVDSMGITNGGLKLMCICIRRQDIQWNLNLIT